ncbi:MAG: DUF362 domain-containing protein [Candidatus Nanoarchaeia archaeon]|nr:DUF362 domain-containing protein [Candidatus Nanoarchaeia archaeon]
MIKVALIKAEDYSESKKCVERLIKLLDFKTPGKKILLKPNMLDPYGPEKAVTTHPEIVKAVANYFSKKGVKIYVGDGSGGKTPEKTLTTFEKTGIKDAVKGLAEFTNFDEDYERVGLDNKDIKKILIGKKISEADLVINLCKLKTHVLTIMTGAVKNTFGCLYGSQKKMAHIRYGYAKSPKKNVDGFSEFLVDLHSKINPQLNIMDGILAMEGNGPSAGEVIKANVMLASTNAFALDYVAAKIMGFDPMKIPTIRISIEKGKFIPADIEVVGGSIEDLKMSFKKPITYSQNEGIIKKIFNAIFSSYVDVDKSSCIKCGKCAIQCPAEAITMNEYPNFDYKKCILCYCCHEMCPKKAIVIKKKLKFKK